MRLLKDLMNKNVPCNNNVDDYWLQKSDVMEVISSWVTGPHNNLCDVNVGMTTVITLCKNIININTNAHHR